MDEALPAVAWAKGTGEYDEPHPLWIVSDPDEDAVSIQIGETLYFVDRAELRQALEALD